MTGKYDFISLKILAISFIFIFLILTFQILYISSCSADTVSNNSARNTNYEDYEDNQEDIKIDKENNQSGLTDNEDNEVVGYEDIKSDPGEDRQDIFLDTESFNSLVDYLNFSYKCHFIIAFLLSMILGGLIAGLVILWFRG